MQLIWHKIIDRVHFSEQKRLDWVLDNEVFMRKTFQKIQVMVIAVVLVSGSLTCLRL